MKNVRNPNFLCNLPHILRTPDNYLVFSILNFFIFYFLSIPSLIGMDNQYYCILKWKKKILKMKKKNLNFEGMKNVRNGTKNVSNPYFYRTLPHIFCTPNNYLVFSIFNFLILFFINSKLNLYG